MRLGILNNGYSFGTKALFVVVRAFSGHALPDAAKLVFYRPDFYGNPMKELTHEAMRGPSPWTVADRELMAAFVSKANQCKFCIAAHTATSSMAYRDEAKVAAALSDPETAPIDAPLKATLQFLGRLTDGKEIDAGDIRSLMAAGVSKEQIEDALAVHFAFSVTDRLANAFGFEIMSQEGFDAGAKYLLKRGYK